MSSRSAEQAVQDDDLLRLREPVRRYLARHTADQHELEDLTQETLARVWEARRRIDREVAASYAVATARNLVLSARRSETVHRRHEHRLHEAASDVQPEESVLQQEERRAAGEALAALEDEDRELLYGHYAQDGAALASSRRPGVTSRLARARSRGRVSYLLALRRVALPTRRCRAVLEALSEGDRRRQQRVGAASHLLSCATCAGCAPALVGRRRALFGILPAPLLLLVEPLRRLWQRAPQATATATATAVVAGAVVAGAAAGAWPHPASPAGQVTASAVLGRPSGAGASTGPAVTQAGPAAGGTGPSATGPAATGPSSTGPAATGPAATGPSVTAPAPGTVTIGGLAIPADRWTSGRDLAASPGAPVVATSVLVQSVPSDEGFWVGDAVQRFWVQVRTPTESPQQIRPGDVVSFSGQIERTGSQPAPGLTTAEGREQLIAQGAYAAVDVGNLREDRPGG